MRPERIRQVRKNLGLTQKELAQEVGISIGYLSDIETGQALPSVGTLKSIAEALGVSVAYLLGESDEPTIPKLRSLDEIASELRKRGFSEHDIAHVLEIARLRAIERAHLQRPNDNQ